MIVDTVIKNGKIVTSSGVYKAGIAIEKGEIIAIAKENHLPKASSLIDINGKFIIPGVIDAHSHVHIPGHIQETFETGTSAAAVGGVTTILEMPTGGDEQLTTTLKGLEWKQNIGEKNAIVDFGLYGGHLVEKKDTQEIKNLVEKGVVGFKIFLIGRIRASNGVIIESFKKIAEAGSVASIHAENHELFCYFKNKLVSKEHTDPVAHTESRPNIVESEAISRVILLAKYAGTNVHIAHMSTKEGVEQVREAKIKGQSVTSEVCPHHLLLTKKDYKEYGPHIVMNPPVRLKKDAEALWKGLSDGTVDALATDHCAFYKYEKEMGLKDIFSTPPGIPNFETYISLVLSEGVNKRKIPLERFVKFTSENPAKIFGLYPRKGTLRVGSDADLTIIDLKKEYTIKADQLRCAGDYTPFEGRKVRGKPILTIVRGEIVAKDGEIIAKPGYGRFIPSARD